MATVIAQGTTISGLVSGCVKSVTTPTKTMNEIVFTCLADTTVKKKGSGLTDMGEFTLEIYYEGTLPTLGTAGTFTVTFPDASTVSQAGYIKEVGGIVASVDANEALTFSVTIVVTGPAV